uniref:KELP n=1 Tax=Arundo donax TaxID=35708 RepID=A0A0A9E8B7_ARUDO
MFLWSLAKLYDKGVTALVLVCWTSAWLLVGLPLLKLFKSCVSVPTNIRFMLSCVQAACDSCCSLLGIRRRRVTRWCGLGGLPSTLQQRVGEDIGTLLVEASQQRGEGREDLRLRRT